MIKVLVLYPHPKDRDAFEQRYEPQHMPLAAKIPHLRKLLGGILTSPDGSQPPFYRIAELHFDDRASMEKALASPEMQRAGADAIDLSNGGPPAFMVVEPTEF